MGLGHLSPFSQAGRAAGRQSLTERSSYASTSGCLSPWLGDGVSSLHFCYVQRAHVNPLPWASYLCQGQQQLLSSACAPG